MCWKASWSSPPRGRESPDVLRSLILNHSLTCLEVTPSLGFCVFWEESPNQNIKSQPPSFYPSPALF